MTNSSPFSPFPQSLHLHASCVAIKNVAVVIMGESAGGKSDLALRLIDRGATLVSDDQVVLHLQSGIITADAPENIKGLLEIRGVGIFHLPFTSAPLGLIVQLSENSMIERLPYPESYSCLGIDIPQIRVCGFHASAPVKIEMAVAALHDASMMSGAFTTE